VDRSDCQRVRDFLAVFAISAVVEVRTLVPMAVNGLMSQAQH
jgi:hypothetical protein